MNSEQRAKVDELLSIIESASGKPFTVADKANLLMVAADLRRALEQPASAAGVEGMVLVPREFMRGFSTLAHNWSLKAEPPEHYDGLAGDAFTEAYRRCGADLAKLKAMLPAAPKPEDAA